MRQTEMFVLLMVVGWLSAGEARAQKQRGDSHKVGQEDPDHPLHDQSFWAHKKGARKLGEVVVKAAEPKPVVVPEQKLKDDKEDKENRGKKLGLLKREQKAKNHGSKVLYQAQHQLPTAAELKAPKQDAQPERKLDEAKERHKEWTPEQRAAWLAWKQQLAEDLDHKDRERRKLQEAPAKESQQAKHAHKLHTNQGKDHWTAEQRAAWLAAKKQAHGDKEDVALPAQRNLGFSFPSSFGSFAFNTAWGNKDQTLGEGQTLTKGNGGSKVTVNNEGTLGQAVGSEGSASKGNWGNMNNSWGNNNAFKHGAMPVAFPAFSFGKPAAPAPQPPAQAADVKVDLPAAVPAAAPAADPAAVPAAEPAAQAVEAAPVLLVARPSAFQTAWGNNSQTMGDTESLAMGNGNSSIFTGKKGSSAESVGTEGTMNKASWGNNVDAWGNNMAFQN